MFSSYAKREWLTVLAIGLMLTCTLVYIGLWWLAIVMLAATAAVLSFFRDPDRDVPSQRGVMLSPADGHISSIHTIEHFEPFDGPAVCVRVFLSVLDVHVNRSPCHGCVESITYKQGRHANALNPDSAEINESLLMVLSHPVRRFPFAAVRQVAGLLARTIVNAAKVGDTLQRGQRFGMILLGSTTEVYLPETLKPKIVVHEGQKVYGGLTILANITTPQETTDAEQAAEGKDMSIKAETPECKEN